MRPLVVREVFPFCLFLHLVPQGKNVLSQLGGGDGKMSTWPILCCVGI